MIRNTLGATLATIALAILDISSAHAQARSTANQAFQLSAFGGITGVYTGLNSGRNLSITAGGNLGFPTFYGFRPSATVRGTYPVKEGQVDGQRNILAGLQVEKYFHRLHPYVDFLIGRGQINYTVPFPDPDARFYYIQSTSNILSPGVGVDFDVTDHFAIKGDFQYQRYSIPVTVSGHIYSKPITVGVVYRFDFNHHKHASNY